MTTTTELDPQTEAEASSLVQAIKDGSLGLDLRGANLAGQDMSQIDLAGADLTGADLSGANLRGARLFKANLVGVSLRGADLTDAELSGANLTGAHMEEAVAANAGFGMAVLRDAQLFHADLKHASFNKADLTGADMRLANLDRARLREATLNGTDMTGATLSGADLSLSDVMGATFHNADLREARIRMLGNYDRASWIGVDINHMNFSGAYRIRRFIIDENFIKEFRSGGRMNVAAFHVWRITSDCGRSMARWCAWTLIMVYAYALIYTYVDIDFGPHPTAISPLYFSVVTMTTLGFGDVVPKTIGGQSIVMTQVLTGYLMLGGLLSILNNKLARRGD